MPRTLPTIGSVPAPNCCASSQARARLLELARAHEREAARGSTLPSCVFKYGACTPLPLFASSRYACLYGGHRGGRVARRRRVALGELLPIGGEVPASDSRRSALAPLSLPAAVCSRSDAR
jgi:hypothetical protein